MRSTFRVLMALGLGGALCLTGLGCGGASTSKSTGGTTSQKIVDQNKANRDQMDKMIQEHKGDMDKAKKENGDKDKKDGDKKDGDKKDSK